MFGIIPGLHQLEASSLPTHSVVANSNVSRHWQVPPGSQKLPWLTVTSVYIAFFSLNLTSHHNEFLSVTDAHCSFSSVRVYLACPSCIQHSPHSSVSRGLRLTFRAQLRRLGEVSTALTSLSAFDEWPSSVEEWNVCLCPSPVKPEATDVRGQVTHQGATAAWRLFDTQ